jgi:hypothetical protein
MKPASRRWTSDEITEFDRLLHAGKEAADIAVAINRTRPAIYARLQRLYRKGEREARMVEIGLRAKGKWAMPKVISSKLLQDWTPAEAERLLQLAKSRASAARAAQLLGRRVGSVRRQAKLFGVLLYKK